MAELTDRSKKLERAAAEIARALRNAQSVLVITGAGISAESGLPTYRGIGGLYDGTLTDEAIPIETALSGDMLATRPDVTWKYIAQIADACQRARHNAAHETLARWERQLRDVWVLTQNIDGFHRAAGTQQLIEMHGHVGHLDCMQCGAEEAVDPAAGLQGREIPPRCDVCGGIMRPRVVLFGEMLPPHALALYDEACARQPQVVLSIGTTSVFPYIAAPVISGLRRGALTVEINPGESEVSELVDYRLQCGAIEALSAIDEALRTV